jgi:hypothetical protein
MIDLRAPIVLRELANGEQLRTRQLLARGANLQAIFTLAANREIAVSGSDERARITWALTPA